MLAYKIVSTDYIGGWQSYSTIATPAIYRLYEDTTFPAGRPGFCFTNLHAACAFVTGENVALQLENESMAILEVDIDATTTPPRIISLYYPERPDEEAVIAFWNGTPSMELRDTPAGTVCATRIRPLRKLTLSELENHLFSDEED